MFIAIYITILKTNILVINYIWSGTLSLGSILLASKGNYVQYILT